MRIAIAVAGCTLTEEVCSAAAATGQLLMCMWLQQQGCPLGERLDQLGPLAAAAGGGHRDVCEWLLSNGFPWSWSAVEAAARGGHAPLAEWLLQRLPGACLRVAESLLIWVAEGCDLITLQRLWLSGGSVARLAAGAAQPRHAEDVAPAFGAAPALIRTPSGGGAWPLDCALADAAASPTPDWAAKVEWLEAQGCPLTSLAGERVAAYSDAATRLPWLRRRGYPMTPHAATVAARHGNAAALRYLLTEAAVRPDGTAAVGAARCGHLAALQLLHAAGCVASEHVGACVVAAARGGHLHVVAWLVEGLQDQVLPEEEAAPVMAPAPPAAPAVARLDGSVLCAGAESGSVELLAWLRERGCPWDDGAVAGAVEGGSVEALEWLAEQGCPVPERACLAYMQAAWRGDLATLRCLRRLGVPWGPSGFVFSYAVEFAPLPVVSWLLEAGCPVDAADALARAQRRRRSKGTEMQVLLLKAGQRRGLRGALWSPWQWLRSRLCWGRS